MSCQRVRHPRRVEDLDLQIQGLCSILWNWKCVADSQQKCHAAMHRQVQGGKSIMKLSLLLSCMCVYCKS